MTETPTLLRGFCALRERGFPLGIAEYQLVLKGIAAGLAETRAELLFLCQSVWAKSVEEQQIVAAVFDATLPEAVTSVPAPAPRAAPASPPKPHERSSPPRAEQVETPRSTATSPRAHVSPRLGMTLAPTPTAGALAASLIELEGRRVTVHPGMILEGDLPITRRQMGRAWRHHRRMQRRGVPTEIDVPATVAAIARTGVLIEPVLVPRRVNFARMLILQDEGGSMVPFRRITRPLLESALHGGLARVEVAWFHDVPGQVLFRDSALSQPVRFERVIEPFRDASILIVSDGGAARGQSDSRRERATVEMLRRIRVYTQNVAWLNPTPAARWPGTTAGAIRDAGAVPMFTLTRRGLEQAVSVLRGRASFRR